MLVTDARTAITAVYRSGLLFGGSQLQTSISTPAINFRGSPEYLWGGGRNTTFKVGQTMAASYYSLSADNLTVKP